ncbi:MAG: hypothetical protein QXL96_02140 [Ignisphaera sp.]
MGLQWPRHHLCIFKTFKLSIIRGCGKTMPVFISDENKFLEIAKNAIECRVKKVEKKSIVKLKARTKRYLYTYAISMDKANAVMEKLKSVCKNIKEV